MTKVKWARRARKDFEAIIVYYDAIDPDISGRIGRQILNATALLRGLPLAGPVALQGDRRKWRVSGTPYVIFYRIVDGHVRILRVLHAAQDQWLA